ncbi:Bacterial flagellin C-terminal helical region [Acididesulfobacillus acetoxydans]|uniref:Flagellin n=1 Tax=Acididesulfobacillus acetoxydans TaxID=1561005 RepID=A0A8S0Y4S5_9FIRM|nr:flagellin [Acididesulfobacillus acetoxydans]CAA7603185.1 Bacterial flagellin C-terminal helical region [Acididesulfobacillus acetoxydans]CEJ07587.1 Flagellin [Acididesulfobacillus acetoxydans]
MSFSINTNVTALNVLFNLQNNQTKMSNVSNQLSSGYKINSAADDAAGLAIANKMNNQVTGLNQAGQNAQDGLSMLQTMEGGISSIQSMLGRMRQLAIESSNGTETGSDRTQIVTELQQLRSEISRTATTTQFNTQTLLTGLAGASGKIQFQVGANKGQRITLAAANANLRATALGITGSGVTALGASGLSGIAQASALIGVLDKALSNVSQFRANVGAVEDRLNFAVTNLGTESNNLSTAQSRIMDTNMASAMTNFTKSQILVNAGISMLAQANQMPGMVLKLLG